MPAKKVTRFLLFVSALGFFVYYGAQNWIEVRTVLGQFDPILIFVAIIFVTASLFCKALLNLQLLRELLHTPLNNVALFHSYTQSQIVKYIPGRIWGVLFQASSLENNVRKSDVWVISILQILILNAFSLIVLMATIAFIDSLSSTVKGTVLVGGFLVFALVYLNFGRILRWARLDESTLRKYAALIDAKLVWRIILIVLFDWIFYIGMWAALAYGQLSYFEVFVTAVNYTTASIVGWLVFILPSGLVVREAAFITFGQIIGENMSLLVVYSVVARLLFLAGDLLLYLLTVTIQRIHERSKGTLGANS